MFSRSLEQAVSDAFQDFSYTLDPNVTVSRILEQHIQQTCGLLLQNNNDDYEDVNRDERPRHHEAVHEEKQKAEQATLAAVDDGDQSLVQIVSRLAIAEPDDGWFESDDSDD